MATTAIGDPAKGRPPPYGTFPPPPPASAPPPPPPPLAAPPPPYAAQYPPQQLPPQYHVVPVGSYQSYAGAAVIAEGLPVKIVRIREAPLPICGIGIGWSLFVAGFFFAAVPWYVATFILLFVRIDGREKAGLVACAVAAVLAAITAIMGFSKNNLLW